SMSVAQARVRNPGHLCVADEFGPNYPMIAALPFGEATVPVRPLSEVGVFADDGS
ncbi:MAG: hypothetical protein QOD62_2703, partial [Actinomycetota bacterium]|nr:hypothetical protein [Actinomycetota bacterium]